MKLSLIVLFLVLVGAICAASGSSARREKRFLKSWKNAFTKIKKFTKTVIKKVDHAIDDSVGFVKKKAGNVKDITKKVIHNVDNAIHKSVDFVKDTAGDVKDITKKVIHNVDNAFDKSVDFVKDTAGDVKDGVNKAAKYTVKISKKVVDKTDKIIDKSVAGVVKAAKFTAKISKKFGKGVVQFSKKAFKATYDAAKKSFNAIKELAKKVDFDAAVIILVDLIDSSVTNKACEVACISSAVYVIGPGALFYANLACPLLCEAVLAYLEDVAVTLVEKHVLND
ncbi:hypothetical protein RRG08_000431 [Elysia crispata]|uniref:Uncharacterized protein n=1 Tax=Elysia crispata TaxID=231223 RepID=A0AAE0YCE5_9GAST|nr:hypothetical protein RRG08_000431 [Elysia crispata]